MLIVKRRLIVAIILLCLAVVIVVESVEIQPVKAETYSISVKYTISDGSSVPSVSYFHYTPNGVTYQTVALTTSKVSMYMQAPFAKLLCLTAQPLLSNCRVVRLLLNGGIPLTPCLHLQLEAQPSP